MDGPIWVVILILAGLAGFFAFLLVGLLRRPLDWRAATAVPLLLAVIGFLLWIMAAFL